MEAQARPQPAEPTGADTVGERSIFLSALEYSDPRERGEFLGRACGLDPALRRRIEGLLRSYAEVGSFLEVPAVGGLALAAPAASERPGDVVGGRYKLLEKIGEGGMGVVYMAEQDGPERRRVAVKVVKPGMDSAQVLARFEAERRALALMDHENIARVLDAGTTDAGRPYFVMELVHGAPITRHCDDNQLTLRQRLELFIPVCRAVQHAHQKGVIHRDLKPSNVLVTMYDGRPVPKVIDFGVAKATEQALTERTLFTRYGALVGTFEYMAPEQAEMSALGVDTRSDVYSLGVLLYELLTGTTPLGRERPREAALAELLRQIREGEPLAPSRRLSASGEALADISALRRTDPQHLTKLVRGELDWIVMRCLEKDRARRYETANGLAMDLRRYLDDEPVSTGPPGAGYRLQKFARRNRGLLAAGVSVAAALLLGTAVATVGFLRAREDRDRAVQATAAEALHRAAAEQATALARRNEAAAKRSESVAKRAADRAEAVSNFLREMLAFAHPGRTGGADPTIRQVLDEAARKLEQGSLARDPAVAASVNQTLGFAYLMLGAHAAAEPHLTVGLDQNRAVWGERHPNVASSRSALGHLAMEQGDFAAAASQFRQALEIRRGAFGEEHTLVATSMEELALALNKTGGLAEADALHERALAVRNKLYPARSIQVAHSLHGRANLLYKKGDRPAAEAMLREALDITREVEGPDGRNVPSRLSALGRMVLNRGDHAAAEPLLREAVAVYRKAYGAEHPYQLKPLRTLHESLSERGDRAAAGAVQFDILRVEVAHFTQEIRSLPRNAHAALARADRYARMGRFADALADRERAMVLDPASYDAWFAAAIGQLYLGDVGAYRATAGGMLRRFADTDNPEAAERTAKAYLLGPPGGGADVGRAVALADRSLAFPHAESRVGWFELTKAMAEYRAGRWQSALDRLAKFREHAARINYGDPRYPVGTGLALAAMACHRLGQHEQARRHLGESARLMEACPKPGGADLGPGPDNWAVWAIFHREAAALIEGTTAGEPLRP